MNDKNIYDELEYIVSDYDDDLNNFLKKNHNLIYNNHLLFRVDPCIEVCNAITLGLSKTSDYRYANKIATIILPDYQNSLSTLFDKAQCLAQSCNHNNHDCFYYQLYFDAYLFQYKPNRSIFISPCIERNFISDLYKQYVNKLEDKEHKQLIREILIKSDSIDYYNTILLGDNDISNDEIFIDARLGFLYNNSEINKYFKKSPKKYTLPYYDEWIEVLNYIYHGKNITYTPDNISIILLL